jgi:uncharacterized protein YndB with AHSA1/START domain
MTRQKSFKRFVRSRMEKTGESYTAARAVLLAAEKSGRAERPPLATTDEAIRQRTGRGWEQWFDLLDEWGAPDLPHKEVARRVAAELGIEPLAWNAQAITVSYERARGGRAVGEHPEGFAVTAQKTVAAPVGRLFDAFVDQSSRRRWLANDRLRQRTATKPKSARFDWADDESRVNVTFLSKDEGKSTVVVEHARLRDGEEAQRMKAHWRARLRSLKALLEEGESDV